MAYRVVQWEEAHEKAESRKYKVLSWYAAVNKHDGLGWAHLTQQEDREALYGTWKAILDVASKGPRGERGWIVRSGRALSAEDLAAMTKFRVKMFERALEFFARPEVGWLCREEFRQVLLPTAPGKSAGVPGESPTAPGKSAGVPGSVADRDRQTDRETDNGTEEKKKGAVAGMAELKVRFAALRDQIGELRKKKAGGEWAAEDRVKLRKKERELEAVQEQQASGNFE